MAVKTTYGRCEGCGEYSQLTEGKKVTKVTVSKIYGYCQSCLMAGVATPVIGTKMKISNGNSTMIVRNTRHASNRDLNNLAIEQMMYGVPTEYDGVVPSDTSISFGSSSTLYGTPNRGNWNDSMIFMLAIAEAEQQQKAIEAYAKEQRRQEAIEAEERKHQKAIEERSRLEAYAEALEERKRQKAIEEQRRLEAYAEALEERKRQKASEDALKKRIADLEQCLGMYK